MADSDMSNPQDVTGIKALIKERREELVNALQPMMTDLASDMSNPQDIAGIKTLIKERREELVNALQPMLANMDSEQGPQMTLTGMVDNMEKGQPTGNPIFDLYMEWDKSGQDPSVIRNAHQRKLG